MSRKLTNEVVVYFNRAMDDLHDIYCDITSELDRNTIIACRCSLYDTFRKLYGNHVEEMAVEEVKADEDNT